MASEADVAEVQDLLPPDSDWDDEKVTGYLDGDRTVPEVMLLFWRSRASKFSTMLDVNESGSSRSLSRLYDNAKAMMDYWEERIQASKDEEKEEEQDRPARVTAIKRL